MREGWDKRNWVSSAAIIDRKSWKIQVNRPNGQYMQPSSIIWAHGQGYKQILNINGNHIYIGTLGVADQESNVGIGLRCICSMVRPAISIVFRNSIQFSIKFIRNRRSRVFVVSKVLLRGQNDFLSINVNLVCDAENFRMTDFNLNGQFFCIMFNYPTGLKFSCIFPYSNANFWERSLKPGTFFNPF